MGFHSEIIVADQNLDRLRPLSKEWKILCHLVDIHELACLITKPVHTARIINDSQTLLDVILTNETWPELFRIVAFVMLE